MSNNTILATAPLATTGFHIKATGTTLGNSLIWDNGTNVGIGNTNTSYTLDVSGSGYFSGIVGIGVAPSAWYNSSGYATLQVGNASLFGRNSANSELYLSSNAYDNTSGNPTYITTDFAARYVQNDGVHSWLTAPSGTAGTATTFTERMRITQAGNVGIGTSSPQMPLSVQANSGNGAIRLIGTSSGGTSNAGIYWYDSNDSTFNGYLGNFSTSFDIYNQRSTPMAFYTAGTERMRITSDGRVFIGVTTNPAGGALAVASNGVVVYAGANYRQMYQSGTAMYWFNGSNEAYLSSAGVWTNASDISIKKDVNDIKYGLNEVMKLKPKCYKMVDDDLEQIGFIAQDVEEVIPELVSTSDRGMKGLSYGNLTAVLTKAIQEMNTKLDAQNQTIQSLQEQINILAK